MTQLNTNVDVKALGKVAVSFTHTVKVTWCCAGEGQAARARQGGDEEEDGKW